MTRVTLELDDELIKFLKETAHNLKTQDNRHTDTPIYRIYENQEVERNEGCGDHIRRHNYEGAEEHWCDHCKKLWEESDWDEDALPEVGQDGCDCPYTSGACLTYDKELLPALGGYDGVAFLTEAAAEEEYRKNNHYHFTGGGEVYAESAFRNWELKDTIKAIISIGEQLDDKPEPKN